MRHTSPYQVTKMLGDLYCNYFEHQYGLTVVTPRFFNSYGPGEVPGQYRNVIPNFIYWAMDGRPLPITGTGEETRDFVYVGDIVDGLLRSGTMEQAKGKAFNLASGTEVRIIDLANAINTATGNRAGITFAPKRKWDARPRSFVSIDFARETIGYDPAVDFEEGLELTLEWFRENWDQIEKAARFAPGASAAVPQGPVNT